MDIKKSLKDVLVLFLICVIFGAALAATNMLTADTIAEKRYQQKLEAYYAVMPDGALFDESSDVDITKYAGLPATVKGAKKENNGLGYAIEVETKGYGSGMVIIVGVSPDGIIYGATCSQSNETNGVEKSYGDNFKNLDMEGASGVDLIGGSTMTTGAYRNAVVDALNAATIIGGGRTEEQKYNDAISEALPAGNGEFTKVVLLAAVEGIDAIYEATNGEGYVCVIGTNSKGVFIGVDKDGNVVGDHTDEHKALAEAAIASVKANATVDVDLSQYADNEVIKNYVNYVKKTGTGNYVIEIKTTGQYTPETPIVLLVVIDANGCIVNIQTVSHAETDSLGGVQLQDGKYNTNFVGKDQAGAGAVDTVAGTTVTTTAFKNAINNAFNVYALLQGGDVDFRTEEEKFQDAIEAALPEANDQFTKYFRVEAVEGFDSIYEATNGAGYVCVIGTDSTGVFIGVDKNGVVVGDVSAEHKALAEAAVAIISASVVEELDISALQNSEDREVVKIFRNIKSAHKTASGNFIFEIKTNIGYGGEIVMKVVISKDGDVLDIQVVSHNETPSFGGVKLEGDYYYGVFGGLDETESNGVDFDVIKNGATVTSNAVKQTVTRCFSAATILSGGSTEAEKYAEAINTALPAANGAFTEYFKIEVVEGFDVIYVADNGEGYVCVIGTDSTGVFIGVDKEGNIVGEHTDEHKALAESVCATISATVVEELDISALQNSEDREVKRVFRNINSAKMTATGNYIFEIKTNIGYGGEIVMKVVISKDGDVLNLQVISHNETSSYGGAKLEGDYYQGIFVGKNETDSNGVDFDVIKNGATVTSNAVKQTVTRCFTAATILQGGAN